jgi:hypothetical protein
MKKFSFAVFILWISISPFAIRAEDEDSICETLKESKEHLRMTLPHEPGQAPRLTLYDSKGGKPVLSVKEEGLFENGNKLCGWPGGNYDPKNSGNMVLEKCPKGIPVRSVWGDQCKGTAVLAVEIDERKPPNELLVQYGRTKLLLKLRELPDKSWIIMDSEHAAEKKRKDAADAFLKTEAFKAFTANVLTCLKKSDARCLEAHVASKEPIYFPEIQEVSASSVGPCLPKNEYVTAKNFAACALETRLAQVLRECVGTVNVTPSEKSAQLNGGQYTCDLIREDGRWKFGSIYVTP